MLLAPRWAPFDLFETEKKRNRVQLYSRRVFVMNDCDELMPARLYRIRSMVDSEVCGAAALPHLPHLQVWRWRYTPTVAAACCMSRAFLAAGRCEC